MALGFFVPQAWRGALATIAVFLICNAYYQAAPEHQLTDSQYTILQVEHGLDAGTWALDEVLPRPVPLIAPDSPPARYHRGVPGLPYQLQVVDGEDGPHIVHWYPPGTSLVATPLLWLARQLHAVPPRVNPRSFNGAAEEPAQALLAGWLTAAFAAAVCALALGWLPVGWAVALALAVGLGTMAFSVSSRGLWTSTTASLFQMLALLELSQPLRRHQPRALHPVWLATCLSWAWFCRPTMAMQVAAMGLFAVWLLRVRAWPLLVAGALWLAAFVGWSHLVYGTWLPDYYLHAAGDGTPLPWNSLAANLFSPSRGVLVYAPLAWAAMSLPLLHWHAVRREPLVALALVASLLHLAVLAVFPTWWGGHGYGARYAVELLPWIALGCVLGLRMALDARSGGHGQPLALRATAAWFTLLAVSGVAVNWAAGWQREAMEWNIQPTDVNAQPEKAVWDWRYPQFLVGLIGYPLPEAFAIWPLGEPLAFGAANRERPFLLERWGGGEPDRRWAYGPTARMAIGIEHPQALRWTIEAMPYCPLQDCDQGYRLRWNGVLVDSFHLHERRLRTHRVDVPARLVAERNVVTVEFLNPISPHAARGVRDFRPLGLAVHQMTLAPVNTPD